MSAAGKVLVILVLTGALFGAYGPALLLTSGRVDFTFCAGGIHLDLQAEGDHESEGHLRPARLTGQERAED